MNEANCGMNDMARFTIIVGTTSLPLGLSQRQRAIDDAKGEALRRGGGGKVSLIEQTADRGAVIVPFTS